jgi:hypothetical protein
MKIRLLPLLGKLQEQKIQNSVITVQIAEPCRRAHFLPSCFFGMNDSG